MIVRADAPAALASGADRAPYLFTVLRLPDHGSGVSKRRVVVTGLGIISPVGSTVASAWDAILNGQSGIGPITRFDVSAFPVRFGGEVRGFDVDEYITPKEARRMDPFMHYGVAAGMQAVADSGIDFSKTDPHRCGAVCGAGIGGLWTIEAEYGEYLEGEQQPAQDLAVLRAGLDHQHDRRAPLDQVQPEGAESRRRHGVHDLHARHRPRHAHHPVRRCGRHRRRRRRDGDDACAASAASARPRRCPRATMSRRKASRPWDRDRDGFVLGDGGGAVMLEELEHAKKRGARIYAELVGFGMSGDAHHITAPPEDGEGARLAMANALQDAQHEPERRAVLNAHATSTPLGDKAETIAMKRAFGDHAKKLAVSSTKSMTGHLLGAAGVAEAIFSMLAIRDNVAPPTINYDNPDPDCDLDYVPNTARQMKIDVALSNSFGFGGTNGTVIFRRFKD